MNVFSAKQQAKENLPTDQEKINLLISDFGKLEESRKDYIRELTRKLAEIHYSGDFADTSLQKGRRAFSNTNCSKGVFV